MGLDDLEKEKEGSGYMIAQIFFGFMSLIALATVLMSLFALGYLVFVIYERFTQKKYFKVGFWVGVVFLLCWMVGGLIATYCQIVKLGV